MSKRSIPIILAVILCIAIFPANSLAASANLKATYNDGVVAFDGSGYEVNHDYLVRVVDNVNKTLKAMGQVQTNANGTITGSITTGALDKVKEHIVYVNKMDGSLVSSVPLTGKNEPTLPGPDPKPDPTPTPDTEPTVKDGRVSYDKVKPDKDGIVKVEVKDEYVDSAIKSAATDERGVKQITIQIGTIGNAKQNRITIPVGKIAAKSEKIDVTVNTGFGDVVLTNEAIESLAKDINSKVTIVISPIDKSSLTSIASETIGNRAGVHVSILQEGKPVDADIKIAMDYKPVGNELADYEHIVVYKVAKDGSLVIVSNGRYNKETGKVTVDGEANGTYAVGFVKKTFEDTSKHKWAEKQISVLASKGIIGGTSNTTFSPEKNITRADFLKLLVDTLGLQADINGNFDDVAENAYYYNEVAIAKALGIVSGQGANQFNPTAEVSRQDMMVMVDKALHAAGKPGAEGSKEDLQKYKDADKIAKYALDSVASLTKEGIVQGNVSGINPTGKTTRAEAAVILHKLYNR
ncbi:S-layer homology domain-containing protein [Paenibacillus marinisediminis]